MWWENEFLKVRRNKLYIGRRLATHLAERFGTPLFVYSRQKILANYQKLEQTFANLLARELRICYAMKANPHPEILKILLQQGAWIDAVSPGEVEAALRAGFPGHRILFTGTSLSKDDLSQVFKHEGVTVNIDAVEQLEMMAEVKRKSFAQKRIPVSIRWNPGLGRGFNPSVVTAGKKSPNGTPIKFGIEEKRVLETFEQASWLGFKPVGLHQHLGSGWVAEDYPAVEEAVERMIAMAKRLEKHGHYLEFLDFGGGIGPKYAKEQRLFPLEKYASAICRKLNRAGLSNKAVALEPGKFLVADAGVLLLRVEYVKKSYGQIFACVNGGTYTCLPRLAIYPQAYHEILNCSRVRGRKKTPMTVAGNLCETGDVFAKEIRLPLPRRGDILAILHAGAYGRSMASTFNLREMPGEIFL
ncbi:MAG: diaminopimelate decarboxylase [Candidatus Aminicenantales bacterium]